jgi:two-component system, NtrC family, response regulator PilR
MLTRSEISKTIVVVDDEPVSLNFCSSALRRAGYQVFTASSAKQALDFFQPNRTPVALALIDVVMPETSGIALVKALEQLNPPKRILLMSGYGPDDMKTLVGTEAADYRCVWKPCKPDSFLRCVKNVLAAPTPIKKQQKVKAATAN